MKNKMQKMGLKSLNSKISPLRFPTPLVFSPLRLQKMLCGSKSKNAQLSVSQAFYLYPGRESNPHDRLGSQDFKSCVSTSSTTWAIKKVIGYCKLS